MTAKQLKGKRWKFHPINEAENIGYVTPVKPRKPSPAKKPVQGKDVYKWVFKFNKMNGGFYGSYLFDEKPIGLYSIGKYVRVKLTEVK